MSSPLAIAAVTAVLKDLLNNGLIDHDLASTVGGVRVTALAPDRIKTDALDGPGLNLFMYMVTPNPSWRNADLPSRNDRGERLSNPPLALDLHYLLTAYGSEDFQAEILLGYAMHLLHETPVLSRDAIRAAFTLASGAGDVPPMLRSLSAADLGDQVERVKIFPSPMGTEEISKLWAAFQSHYRPTAAYQASVVLIEQARPVRSPLPVLQRGPRDRGAFVQASATPPPPARATLTAIELPHQQASAQLGDSVIVHGYHLDGDSVDLQFVHPRLAGPLKLTLPGSTTGELSVQLPDQPEAWAAGLYSVTATVHRADKTDEMTNALPLALAPRLTVAAAERLGDGVMLTVQCRPQVHPAQRVSVLLGNRELIAAGRAQPTAELSFQVKDMPAGKYPVRLRVDGVDSLLIDRETAPPRFDPAHVVELP